MPRDIPSAGKKRPSAPPVYRPKPLAAQPKVAAPPVYRPKPLTAQPKMTAPPVYRPKPLAAQPKMTAPPVYRPKPAAAQPKLAAPPVYRPKSVAAPVQPAVRRAGAPPVAAPSPAKLVQRKLSSTFPPIFRPVLSRHPIQRMEAEIQDVPLQIPVIPMGTQQPQSITVSGSLEQTSGLHHPIYQFGFGSEAEKDSYDIDPWTTSKTKNDIGPTALGDIKETERKILLCVGQWNRQTSIIDDLVNVLIAAEPVSEWTSAKILEPLTQTKDTRLIVKHLLALKGNIKLRIDDIPNNLPTKIKIEFKANAGKKASETVVIDWLGVLAECRSEVRQNILAKTPCPTKHQQIKIATEVVCVSNDSGLAALRKFKLLDAKGKYKSSGTYKEVVNFAVTATILEPLTVVSGQKKEEEDLSFNFGLNHIRFILYLEWRGVSELLDLYG